VGSRSTVRAVTLGEMDGRIPAPHDPLVQAGDHDHYRVLADLRPHGAGQREALGDELVMVIDPAKCQDDEGISTMTIQAPCVNLDTAMTTVTTPVVRAPSPFRRMWCGFGRSFRELEPVTDHAGLGQGE